MAFDFATAKNMSNFLKDFFSEKSLPDLYVATLSYLVLNSGNRCTEIPENRN